MSSGRLSRVLVSCPSHGPEASQERFKSCRVQTTTPPRREIRVNPNLRRKVVFAAREAWSKRDSDSSRLLLLLDSSTGPETASAIDPPLGRDAMSTRQPTNAAAFKFKLASGRRGTTDSRLLPSLESFPSCGAQRRVAGCRARTRRGAGGSRRATRRGAAPRARASRGRAGRRRRRTTRRGPRARRRRGRRRARRA